MVSAGRCWSVLLGALLLLSGCGGGAGGAGNSAGTTEIVIDGSSTVAPISSAVSEEFSKLHRNVRVPVGTKGTGGGFKRFIDGDTDINDASRPIKDSEQEELAQKGIGFVELKVAIDGLTVVVNPANDWVDSMTIDQLNRIWAPGSTVTKWSDVDPAWPAEPIQLFGPDTDSGTFDYFTEVVCGETGASRSDYQQNTDDNFLVTGVAGDKYALGYFGFAYYVENQDRLKALAIVPAEGQEAVVPTAETIESGAYTPLSRPLFLYVKQQSLSDKPMLVEFLDFYLAEEGQELVAETGYVQLSPQQLAATRQTLADVVGH